MSKYEVEVIFSLDADEEDVARQTVDALLDLLVTPHLADGVHWEIHPDAARPKPPSREDIRFIVDVKEARQRGHITSEEVAELFRDRGLL